MAPKFKAPPSRRKQNEIRFLNLILGVGPRLRKPSPIGDRLNNLMFEPERLVHYSNGYLTKVRTVAQKDLTRIYKPNGLWFSVETGNGDGWREWCDAEGFGAPLTHRTEIILRPDARVLRLTTAEELDAFTDLYGIVPKWRQKTPLEGHPTQSVRVPDADQWKEPDWAFVSKKYDCIIIAPYIYERRVDMKSHWYYPWDCASGVVWRARAVKELVALPWQGG